MDSFIDYIKRSLSIPLPGDKAHIEVSPSRRPIASEQLKRSGRFTQSAVAVILFKKQKQTDWHIILTERQFYNGFHSKQISFPGGKQEEVDINLIQTALRESNEEIGLIPNYFELLGSLSPVYIPVSGFRVQPLVFHYLENPKFIREEREVAEIFTFPVDLLLDEKILKTTEIEIQGGLKLKDVPYFHINDKIVWGATALILNEFKYCMNGLNPNNIKKKHPII